MTNSFSDFFSTGSTGEGMILTLSSCIGTSGIDKSASRWTETFIGTSNIVLLWQTTKILAHSGWLKSLPATSLAHASIEKMFFFHGHNCLPWHHVSTLSVLAHRAQDNIALPSSCWTLVDHDWIIKCKHLFRLYSHLTMPDIFSCAGTAKRVWSVGSVERSAALWDFFSCQEYGGGMVLFFLAFLFLSTYNQQNCFKLLLLALFPTFPQRGFIKRFIPFSAVLAFYLLQAGVLKL